MKKFKKMISVLVVFFLLVNVGFAVNSINAEITNQQKDIDKVNNEKETKNIISFTLIPFVETSSECDSKRRDLLPITLSGEAGSDITISKYIGSNGKFDDYYGVWQTDDQIVKVPTVANETIYKQYFVNNFDHADTQVEHYILNDDGSSVEVKFEGDDDSPVFSDCKIASKIKQYNGQKLDLVDYRFSIIGYAQDHIAAADIDANTIKDEQGIKDVDVDYIRNIIIDKDGDKLVKVYNLFSGEVGITNLIKYYYKIEEPVVKEHNVKVNYCLIGDKNCESTESTVIDGESTIINQRYKSYLNADKYKFVKAINNKTGENITFTNSKYTLNNIIENSEYTVYFEKVQFNIVINFLEKGNESNILDKQITVKVGYGETLNQAISRLLVANNMLYDFDSIKAEHGKYGLNSNDEIIISNIKNSNMINVYYKVHTNNVIINYLEKDNEKNILRKQLIIPVKHKSDLVQTIIQKINSKNELYKFDSIKDNIKNYKLNSNNELVISNIVEPIEINAYYIKQKSFKVNIKYILTNNSNKQLKLFKEDNLLVEELEDIKVNLLPDNNVIDTALYQYRDYSIKIVNKSLLKEYVSNGKININDINNNINIIINYVEKEKAPIIDKEKDNNSKEEKDNKTKNTNDSNKITLPVTGSNFVIYSSVLVLTALSVCLYIEYNKKN
ncbi:hypothetical protein [Mycoplasma sp. P36-A1]|uniref:hypothetical protein n=1 Tax=Mycoplasma sp. P36-A1 TaxID=3252900 RepID=UPI003C2AFC52